MKWITNSVKYALPEAPHLSVSLQLIALGTAELVEEDLGPGMPPEFDPAEATTYGLMLVHTMGEQVIWEGQ